MTLLRTILAGASLLAIGSAAQAQDRAHIYGQYLQPEIVENGSVQTEPIVGATVRAVPVNADCVSLYETTAQTNDQGRFDISFGRGVSNEQGPNSQDNIAIYNNPSTRVGVRGPEDTRIFNAIGQDLTNAVLNGETLAAGAYIAAANGNAKVMTLAAPGNINLSPYQVTTTANLRTTETCHFDIYVADNPDRVATAQLDFDGSNWTDTNVRRIYEQNDSFTVLGNIGASNQHALGLEHVTATRDGVALTVYDQGIQDDGAHLFIAGEGFEISVREKSNAPGCYDMAVCDDRFLEIVSSQYDGSQPRLTISVGTKIVNADEGTYHVSPLPMALPR